MIQIKKAQLGFFLILKIFLRNQKSAVPYPGNRAVIILKKWC